MNISFLTSLFSWSTTRTPALHFLLSNHCQGVSFLRPLHVSKPTQSSASHHIHHPTNSTSWHSVLEGYTCHVSQHPSATGLDAVFFLLCHWSGLRAIKLSTEIMQASWMEALFFKGIPLSHSRPPISRHFLHTAAVLIQRSPNLFISTSTHTLH